MPPPFKFGAALAGAVGLSLGATFPAHAEVVVVSPPRPVVVVRRAPRIWVAPRPRPILVVPAPPRPPARVVVVTHARPARVWVLPRRRVAVVIPRHRVWVAAARPVFVARAPF